MKFVGLDLGTTKIAGLLLEVGQPERGGAGEARVRRVASRDHFAALPAAHPWEHLEDPERLLALARELLRELSSEAGPPDGLCITGQMHGVLYVDSAGAAVSPLWTWLDRRAGRPHPRGASYAEVLSARTGRTLHPGYGAATHFYNRDHGLVPQNAVGLCALMDFVSMRLAGARQPATDPTIAASLGLYDLDEGRFDAAALRGSGLAELAWSRVVHAGTRLGATEEGTVVLAPLGDNQASFLGSVRDLEGSVLLNVGTGGQLCLFSRQHVCLQPPLDVRPFPGGGFLLVGASLCAGKAYALLEEFFARVLECFGGRRPEGPLFERMNELVGEAGEAGEEVPLEVDTRFQGTRGEPGITGRIERITPGNLTPAALVRGFLRGIAGELHDRYRQMTQAAGERRISSLVASGNGIRRNPALRAEFGRRFGLPLLVPRLSEEAALGAALCAAVGMGALPGYLRAGEMIEYEAG
jgi:sedoheptulokinase